MLTAPVTKRYERHINDLAPAQLMCPLLTSGNPDNYKQFEKELGEIIFLKSPDALITFLQQNR
jgi:hypothetical protein